jgi:hypothetical protein
MSAAGIVGFFLRLSALHRSSALAATLSCDSPHICAGTRPHLCRDSPTSAPGLAHICAGTHQHLRRDWWSAALCLCACVHARLRAQGRVPAAVRNLSESPRSADLAVLLQIKYTSPLTNQVEPPRERAGPA